MIKLLFLLVIIIEGILIGIKYRINGVSPDKRKNKAAIIEYIKNNIIDDFEEVNYWNGFLMMTDKYILWRQHKKVNCYSYNEVIAIKSKLEILRFGPTFIRNIIFKDGISIETSDNNCFQNTTFNEIPAFIKDKNSNVNIEDFKIKLI